jgi:predicted metalloprotease with PDZ domain
MTKETPHFTMRRATGLLLSLLLLWPCAAAAVAAQAPVDVEYTVAMSKPSTHLFEVTSRFANLPAGREHVDLHFPVWTPGSYLVREFARHVQDFAATSGGQAARWEKIDKNTWRVWPNRGAREVAATYRVYANELTVRTSHLDASHGYFNGANLFLYTDASLRAPARLTIRAPQGWRVATGLEQVSASGSTYTFRAPDFDVLVDAPVEIGTHDLLTFEALGKPHEIAIWGKGTYEPERLKADFKKIVETSATIFGKTLPYDRYVFIVHLFPGGGGGLEHLNSTTVIASPYTFSKKESYQGFLGLVAHEFFHLWLVKRIRPVALGPFDYANENYTKMLWVMEGTTDHYANVILQRAGLMTEDEYWNELAKMIKSLQSTPGRKHLSLEEASFDAWIKYYRQNEHSVNDQISYYLKGAIVSAMLDLEIRGRTNGGKSLDDVLRYLWETYATKGQGVPEDAMQPAVEAVAGGSFEEFFDKYVRGTDEIDYAKFLAVANRRLVTEAAPRKDRVDESKPGAWLGANVRSDDGRTVVTSVLEDSPAWEAGINSGDEILAVDGMRVTSTTLNDRLADRAPGDESRVTLFRRDALLTVPVRLGERPPETYKIEAVKK